MSKTWGVFSLLILIHLFTWLQAPRLPYPELIADEILLAQAFKYLNYKLLSKALLNTILIGLLTVVISLLFTVPLAIFISRSKDSLIKKASVLLYLPILSPLLLPALGLYELFARYELTGSYIFISLAQASILYPYMLKPIETTLITNGEQYEKVAKSLGANPIETFYRVTLPNLKKPMLIGSFFVFIGSFNDYIISFLIGDFQIKTLSIYLYPLMQSDNRMTSVLIILIYVLPLIIISALLNYMMKINRKETDA